VARQLVVDRGQGWQREATIEAIAQALPDTLGEVIARHVDLLAPAEREALEAAAAVGLEFTVEFVSFAMQQSPDYIRQQFTPLARRGHLIAATQTNRSARAPQTFRFRHSLYAELIAQQAPMLRQRRVLERINQAKENERSLQTLRRA
jgi:hypothetical protein